MSRKCIWLVVVAVAVALFAGMAHGKSVNVCYADGHANNIKVTTIHVKSHNTPGPGNNYRFWRPVK